MLKDYSEFWISSVVAIEPMAALYYSWSIRYIVNRAPVTARTEFQHKVDRAGGKKEKKEANKPSEATQKDDTKHVQKKKAKPKSQATSAKSDKSDTTKKAKEPGEDLINMLWKRHG